MRLPYRFFIPMMFLPMYWAADAMAQPGSVDEPMRKAQAVAHEAMASTIASHRKMIKAASLLTAAEQATFTQALNALSKDLGQAKPGTANFEAHIEGIEDRLETLDADIERAMEGRARAMRPTGRVPRDENDDENDDDSNDDNEVIQVGKWKVSPRGIEGPGIVIDDTGITANGIRIDDQGISSGGVRLDPSKLATAKRAPLDPRTLGLSADQERRIAALRADSQTRVTQAQQARAVAQRQLSAELQKLQPTETALRAALEAMAAADVNLRLAELQAMLAARRVLTEAQRRLLAAQASGK